MSAERQTPSSRIGYAGFVLFVAVQACKLPTLSDHIRRCELYGVPEDAARIRFRQFMTKREAPAAAAQSPARAGEWAACIEYARASIAREDQPAVRVHLAGCEDRAGKVLDALRDMQKVLEDALETRNAVVNRNRRYGKRTSSASVTRPTARSARSPG